MGSVVRWVTNGSQWSDPTPVKGLMIRLFTVKRSGCFDIENSFFICLRTELWLKQLTGILPNESKTRGRVGWGGTPSNGLYRGLCLKWVPFSGLRCKSDQMSLSLPKKWIVVVAIPSYSSVDWSCFLRELSPILGAMSPLASTPWKASVIFCSVIFLFQVQCLSRALFLFR